MNLSETAISIKQPWAYLIAAGIKDIENRTWKCPQKYIGQRILIHASAKQCEIKGLLTVTQQEYLIIKIPNKMPLQNNIVNGAIIGSVEIVDCVVNHTSIWAEKSEPGQCEITGEWIKPIYNWVLANPILFDEPIMNVKGKLGFWNYEFSEDDYECTNDNGYTLGSCGEKVGCIQDCGRCDYYKCKYEIV